MADFLISNGFSKAIPTDMDWAGTFDKGYVIVSARWVEHYQSDDGKSECFYVSVTGNDDTSLQRWFNNWEETLAWYNSLTYIQSNADLQVFVEKPSGNNGWPSERHVYTERDLYAHPQFDDTPRWMNSLYHTQMNVFGQWG